MRSWLGCHQVVYSLFIKEVIQVFLCIISDLITSKNEVIPWETIIEAPQYYKIHT